jgi:apolipoprotein D and lipocalin family protein
MKPTRLIFPLTVAGGAVLALTACASLMKNGRVGNRAVPQPAKHVDLNRYLGLWYEIGRYENHFETDCEGVTAEYRKRDDGLIDIINASRKGSLSGPVKTAHGKARVLRGSDNAKLKVSFFGPFYVGDYWVLDHADDYAWSIVGEPSGRYLWLLSRTAHPDELTRNTLEMRTRELGYDWSMVRMTQH